MPVNSMNGMTMRELADLPPYHPPIDDTDPATVSTTRRRKPLLPWTWRSRF